MRLFIEVPQTARIPRYMGPVDERVYHDRFLFTYH